MLRKIRLTLAIVFWLLVTWLLVDFTGTAHQYLGWMAKIQFMPALLAVNVSVLLFLLVLTLVFGRIYCSVICPLGVMQDVIAWFRRKRNKYKFTPAHNKLRHGILIAVVVILVANLGWLAGLLLPYSTYGRMVGSLAAPLYRMGNNVLASMAEHYGSYAFYEVDVWLKSGLALVISLAMWVLIAVLAWKKGRLWCNAVCPVGTLLGFVSRHAVYRPRIDRNKCNSCGLCERNCKSSCIDSHNHEIDLSRCVMCGDCMEVCRKSALTLGTEKPDGGQKTGRAEGAEKNTKPRAPRQQQTTTKRTEKTVKADAQENAASEEKSQNRQRRNRRRRRNADATNKAEGTEQIDNAANKARQSRRNAIATTAMLLTGSTLVSAQKKVESKTTDGGLADIEPKKAPTRQRRILPPGALSARHMQTHCTACQLCVTSCPNDVLRPSTSLSSLLQPIVSYERGYCRPECNRCSQVCPTGAIQPITVEQRTAVQVGHAVWVKDLCIPATEGKPCGNCARHCPSEAIQLVPASDKYQRGERGRWKDPSGKEIDGRMVPMIPVVNEEKCIGCGACENLCPVRPYSAIYVEGNEVQREI